MNRIVRAAIAAAGSPQSLHSPARNKDMKNEEVFRQIFPQGEKLPERFSQYFTGRAWLAPLTANTALNVPVSNVTFEPGCRTTGTATRAAAKLRSRPIYAAI